MPRQYAENKKLINEATNLVNKASEKIFQDYVNKNPAASALRMRPMNFCYIKKPSAYYKVFTEIGLLMAVRDYAKRTQKSLLDELKPRFPELNINSSIWSKRMSGWRLEKLKSKIRCNMSNPVNINSCKTLAEIKKCLVTALNAQASNRTIKASISISRDAVVIKKTSYKVTLRTVGGRAYPAIRINVNGRRQWVNINLLEALFL